MVGISLYRKYAPVWLLFTLAMASGGPVAMIQSAVRMISRGNYRQIGY